jgi:hypothetical protein
LDEELLKTLMLSSLRGDAAAYRQLLSILVGELRILCRLRGGMLLLHWRSCRINKRLRFAA